MRQLHENEKNSYLQAIIYIAKSDGNITEEEKLSIEIIAGNMGINNQTADELVLEIKQGKSLEDILKGIQSRDIKLLLIYELITICYADGDYTNNEIEKETIKSIAKLLNIELEKVVEIEDLIAEYIQFQEKVNKALEVGINE